MELHEFYKFLILNSSQIEAYNEGHGTEVAIRLSVESLSEWQTQFQSYLCDTTEEIHLSAEDIYWNITQLINYYGFDIERIRTKIERRNSR